MLANEGMAANEDMAVNKTEGLARRAPSFSGV
jgi:hypothetical protein